MPILISEKEFQSKLSLLEEYRDKIEYVTGPGRSGAIASVYASHYLKVPFISPCEAPLNKKGLIIDTAVQTGKTLRKLKTKLPNTYIIALFKEPPSIRFWFEFPIKETKKNKKVILPNLIQEFFLTLLLPFIWLSEYIGE